MLDVDNIFIDAAKEWDLQRLYQDLTIASEKKLTSLEKLQLRGLLCGHSPAEIATQIHKDRKGIEVDLSNRLYPSIKNLISKQTGNRVERVKNWRNISQWLASAGYKIPSLDTNTLALNENLKDQVVKIVSSALKIQNVICNANCQKIVFDINIRMVAPLPTLSNSNLSNEQPENSDITES